MIYGSLYTYWCIQVQLLIELVNTVLLQCPVTAILASALRESQEEEGRLACAAGVTQQKNYLGF